MNISGSAGRLTASAFHFTIYIKSPKKLIYFQPFGILAFCLFALCLCVGPVYCSYMAQLISGLFCSSYLYPPPTGESRRL